MRLSTIRRTDVHDEFALHRTRFGEEVHGVREVGDTMKASNRVEGRLWNAGAEMTLFYGIGGPCEEELGEDLVESLAGMHVCRRKRESAQVKFF